MNQIDWVGVAVVAAMYAVFLLVGWLAVGRLKNRDAADLLVAGRTMPVWIAVITMTATWVDGGYLLGTAEYTYKHGITYGAQGGLCFGLSLIMGGLFFATKMRRMEFSTMVDAFDVRFGPRWAAVLSLPAMLGELLWSGALLVAIGATFGELLHLDLTTAILVSAVVVTAYTVVGGMWSVAYTDVVQLGLIPIGMLAALPFALDRAGGICSLFCTCTPRVINRPRSSLPPMHAGRRGLDGAFHRRVVGHDDHADLRRNPLELLFPTRVVLRVARQSACTFALGRLLDLCLNHTPIAAGDGRICDLRSEWN